MSRRFVREAHHMLTTVDDVFRPLVLVRRWILTSGRKTSSDQDKRSEDVVNRPLVLVRRWILLSVRHTCEDDQQQKKLHRAHDLKSSLPSDCRRTGNNASSWSWPDALEQLCDLPRLCPAQSLVPLLRQSMHLGAQG